MSMEELAACMSALPKSALRPPARAELSLRPSQSEVLAAAGVKAAPKPKREECEVGPELEPLLVQWWDRLGAGADASRSRQALKAELAAEEAKGRQQRQEAETARCQDLEMLRVVLGGRVLALDLSSSLRDVRLLGACGSAAALAEALSELLLSLRRAAALCGAHRQEVELAEAQHRDRRQQQEEQSRQRRVELIRRLAKAGTGRFGASAGDPLELLSAGGVPLLAEIAHE
ncbi:unnamed protein product, partial [Effrenium voratum]